MSGLIGADNQFGREFHRPDTKLQGLIVSIYDVRTFLANVKLSIVMSYRSVVLLDASLPAYLAKGLDERK
jgi:hypothetical protein